MTAEQIRQIVQKQRLFFSSGATLPVNYRIAALKKLRSCILKYEGELHAALKRDLGKSAFESYMCETGLVLSELSYMERHIRRFTKERTVPTPLAQFCARSYRKPSPYGAVLIMSPWNYPFLLTIDPLIAALAAGNTAILKPSAYSPATGAVIQKIIAECFAPEYVSVILGGRAENTCLLEERFDYIFFTGSSSVGKEVMRRASEHLTPITLELGGKSPCIVEKTADLKLAAKRIVFGKYLNCGQTCVAPDYIYCDRTVKDALLRELKKQIALQFGEKPLDNENYGKIINEKHFLRISGFLEESGIVHGGKTNREALQIEPTILDQPDWDSPVMQEEIFGPVLPVLTYDTIEEAILRINSMPHPLALYLFTSDQKLAGSVTAKCGFGGGCINDVVIHLATSQMGFGGFGESGMGSYHGKDGFDAFTHYKSIVDKKTWLDLPMRYQPYTKINEGLLKRFLR